MPPVTNEQILVAVQGVEKSIIGRLDEHSRQIGELFERQHTTEQDLAVHKEHFAAQATACRTAANGVAARWSPVYRALVSAAVGGACVLIGWLIVQWARSLT